MAKRIQEEDLHTIEDVVRAHPARATAQQIADALQEPPPRRTLQYRLKSDAVLGVYELNKVELLKDIFVWAYKRSADRYVAVR